MKQLVSSLATELDLDKDFVKATAVVCVLSLISFLGFAAIIQPELFF